MPFWILASLFVCFLFGNICCGISFCNSVMLDSQEIDVYANRIQNSNSPQDTELVSTSHMNRFTIPSINLYGSVPTVGSARGVRSPRSIYLTDSATHGSSPSELGPTGYGAYTSPPEAQTTSSIGVSHVATTLGVDFQFRTPTNTITPVQTTIEVSVQVSNTPSGEGNEERFGEEENDNEDDVITEIESSDDNEYQNCYECYDQLVEENNSEETYYLWEEVDGEGPVIILYGPGENWGEVESVDWSEDELVDRSEDEWDDWADINPPTIPGSPPYEVLTPGARTRYLDDLEISVNRLISTINITGDDG